MFLFGPWKIRNSEIFYCTPLTFAFVNLKPVVPGHVLLSPHRVVQRFQDLTKEEVDDLFESVQVVGKMIEQFHNASSLTITVQDGPQAGQSVPHVHVHVMPRIKGDYLDNDDIYGDINKSEKQMNVDNESRQARTEDDMAQEAAQYRPLLKSTHNIW
ncbi:HIT-like domain-containing protein [Gorgonomyces haynaldii]|nr:HIT-like domain-containing protein [Gorgonomyces haynaldii]